MIDREAALQNVGKPVDSSPEVLIPPVPDNLIEKEELWEFELDLLGAAAVPEKLQQILERAPNPESATAQFLMGYLASYEKKSI